MISKAVLVLKSARQKGIHISVNNGELQLKLSKANGIDPKLLQEIKDNKEGIIDFLYSNDFKSTKVHEPENSLKHYDRDITKPIRLSFGQERLWFIHQMEGTVQYHLPTVLRLTGKLNGKALANALQTVVGRHESLRSVIIEKQGEAYQQVMDAYKWELLRVDGSVYKNDSEGLKQYIHQLIRKPFDLSNDYMLRTALVCLEEEEHLLIVNMHHIASDGWSVPIIVKEVLELYESYTKEQPSGLTPLEVQYADFAIWQRNYLQGPVLEKKIGYWKKKLNEVSPLQLPTDFARPVVQSSRGASITFTIEKNLADKVQLLCHKQGATLFMTLLAAFKVLLHRYSGQQDICIGTPVAGRHLEEIEGLIGLFVNTLALRTEVRSEDSFISLLEEVKKTTIEAYEHQEAPFEKVVEAVAKGRDPGRSVIFQVMFILQNTPDIPELKLSELKVSEKKLENDISKFDISLYLTEAANGLQGSIDYSTDLYQEQTIARLIDHYKVLLISIVENPQQKTGLLPILGRAEEQQLLAAFNDNKTDYPANKNIIELFEEQVEKTPENIAIVFEGTQLSYKQLNSKANQFANYLRSKGVKQETLVPVCIERSVEMIVALLGILKAGGAYVPIDPDYPAERIRFMLEDTAVKIIVSSKETALRLPDMDDTTVVEIDDDLLLISLWPANNLEIAVTPQNLAYIMYTSGSTGKPKGVLVQHGNVTSLVKGIDYVNLTNRDVLLSTGSFSFDATTFEYWGMLLNGGQLILCTEIKLLDNKLLKEEINNRNVNKMWFTSSWFNQLIEADITLFEKLETILVGGEKLSEYHIEKIRQSYPHIEIINGYGPTENTTFSLTYRITETKFNRPIPIGRPLNNRNVLILDGYFKMVPVGVGGEICLSGAGVSRGYLNQPELTAEKFVNHSFGESSEAKMYKTGDIGRWLPDGNIEYLGRKDDQVKIRGFRIELGEIESVLQQHESVEQAVVLAREDKQGNKRLVGYIVGPEGLFDKAAINSYLKDKLPDYMVPALWMQLEKLPLTANGKIDRQALPDPDAGKLSSNEYIAPRSELEVRIAEIWKQLLEINQVGIHDNFFELGGHSLLATRVLAAIRKHLEVDLVINVIFNYPTIASLAAQIENQSTGNELLSIARVQPRPEFIPLSFGQERLWFIDRLQGSVQYYLPSTFRLKGKLDKDALERALQYIVNRHEILRTVILEEQGKSYQSLKEKDSWRLHFTDGTAYKNNSEALQQYIHQLIKVPFNLSVDYMLRANLISMEEDDNMLVVNMHHIASDGWSTSIIVRELVEVYAAFTERRPVELVPLPIQYADYAIWQRNYLQGEVLDSKLAYWKEKLQEVPTLQLPTDYPRPAVQSTRGANTRFSIDKELTEQLNVLSQQQGTTLFMTLLAAFNIMLQRYSGQQDICVGTPIAGRRQQEVETLIGFFINSLALRSDLSNNPSFTDLLQQVKTTTLEAYANQDVPFEKVVEVVGMERDMSRNPLFPVLLTLQNTPEIPVLRLGEITLSVEEYEHNTSQLDIICNITETKLGLQGTVVYCTDLFTEHTIRRMMEHFKQLLGAVVQSPHHNIGSLSMLSPEEEHQLLVGFNDTKVAYPPQKTIITLFEQQVTRTPGNVAVVFEQEQLSYQQLNERANQLACYLKLQGIKEEQLVPLCIKPGQEMLVVILGILKAGAAYVPIDPDYPEERIGYLLEDSGASVIISNRNSEANLPVRSATRILLIDEDRELISRQLSENLLLDIDSRQLAYVIYTSGSTGKPKGVMIEHRSMCSYLLNHKTRYINEAAGASGSFVHLAYTFDASLTAMFMPLLSGKSVVIGSSQTIDVFEDSNLHKYAPYDFIKITPSHLELLQPKMRTWNGGLLTSKLVIGGEALLLSQLNDFVEEGLNITIVNEYGPTEATVGCSVYSFDIGEIKENGTNNNTNNSISIGKPIDNVELYILGDNNELLPVGVAGELCIGGDGLARGYLNRPELTAEKFIKNPFSKEEGSRLYKTGDLARWSMDGNITYLGRKDEQVKVRGYRIELGEIECVLWENQSIRQAVVLARENKSGSKRLVGYVVPHDTFRKEEVVSYLESRLPEYMIPVQWVVLETIPLTNNGKTDRKALPDPDVTALLNKQYVAPRNEIEKVLAEIWQDLLDVDTVSIYDNFFELGGDSIIIIQIVSRARRAGYELQVSDIFTYQTIARLSAVIEKNADNVAGRDGEQGLLTGESGLVPIQQWYFESAAVRDISHFNQSILLNINKSVTESDLQYVLEQLTAHHDALRFVYQQVDGKWKQEYGIDKGLFVIEDLHNVSEGSVGSIVTDKADFYQRSLNIEKGELVRMVLMQTPVSEVDNRLLIVIHHLAIDGVSWRILLEDMELLLNGLNKGEKPVIGHKSSSYRQWYNALENYGHSKHILSQENYWQQAAKSYYPLPVDHEYIGPLKEKDMAWRSIRLNQEQTSSLLQDVPRVYHTEINDILLAALAYTLSNWSGKEKVHIGLEGHGREDVAAALDISRTVGWFTSMYPLVLVIPATKSEGDLIISIKEQLRQLPDKGLGYGLLKYINKEASLQGPEPWDVVFNYFGQLDNVVRESRWLSAADELHGAQRSDERIVGEKISINSSVLGGELVINWLYSSKHYHEETIIQLSEAYLYTIEKLIAHCIEQQRERGIVYTPSDYGLGSEITFNELDQFLKQPFNGKIRKDAIDGIYRLSGLQEGMLFHGLYDAGIGAYIEQLGCELSGVDIDTFYRSWLLVIKNHSILRSAFYFDEFKVPVQCVYKEVALPLVVLDYSTLSNEEQAEAIKIYEEADRDKGIDFKVAPLMRLTLFRLSENRYRLLWTSHHILFDGWSFPILMEEFLTTYELLSTGQEAAIVEEDRYEDYIRYIERSDKEQEEQYWRNYLKGIEQSTLLPFIETTAERNKGLGIYQKSHLNLDAATAAKIQVYAQRHHLTLNTLMQGVWSYLLHRYTGMKNVVFGIVVSGRPDDLSLVEKRVGMYINTLLFHSSINEDQGVEEWLNEIQIDQIHSRQYQHTPLNVAQSWSGVQGDLFDTLLTFENYPVSKMISTKQWALNVSGFSMQEQTNYPLSILITSAEQIDILFSYNAMLLDETYIKEIRGHFEHVLLQIVENEDIKLKDISLLTSTEQQQLLTGFNEIQHRTQPDQTIVALFEEQAAKTPDALAVVCNEESFTYKELNERANKLAHYLTSKGVKKETPVPICTGRSLAMMEGILGILKAGGAYVPIDPDFPEERIAYILEDTGASIVVSNKIDRLKLPVSATLEIVDIDRDFIPVDQHPVNNIKETISADQLAYIIYTSGSTGKPKGVMVEHGSLLNYLLNDKTNYINSKGNNTGSYIHLSYTFDASLTALFMPLLSGKAVIIGSKSSVDIFEDSNLLKYAPYDFIKITPSHIELLQPAFKAFGKGLLTEKLVIGGEALYPGQFDSFIDDGINVEVINEYGPTEAAVGCTTYSFHTLADKDIIKDGIPIGKPIDNAGIYILDGNNKLVPVGVKGEIGISGAGLARGYLNQPGLTAAKFISNPFSNRPGERIYKTGDIGRWLPNGNIEYLGRMDDQVKIRGYRVELGEIEHKLQQCEEVSQAVVIGKEDKVSSKRLIGYYVPDITTVKAKERELNYQRVASWKELYETEYGQTEGDENIDPEFNIIGWNDSFTGEAIPAGDMKEWVDDIVEVVLLEQPENVLEIGCGTGLIYYQLAGKLKKYIGSDLSRSSINQISQRISKGLRNYGDTELFTAPAHEVRLQEDQVIDTILLNSIVQYFPGEDYMNIVIKKCIDLIKDRGRIIIGDVRDNRLLQLFKGRLRMQKLQDSIQVKEFKWALEQDLIKEEELCFSPDYFFGLKDLYPQITHVEIQWKKGSYVNELSLYRYTVVLYVGIEKDIINPQWQSWDDLINKKTVFSDNDQQQRIVAIKDVPNPRLWKEKILQQALQNTSFKTVGDIMRTLEREDKETLQIKQLLILAESKGYSYKLLVHEDPLKINLLFNLHPLDGFIRQPFAENAQQHHELKTNIPLFTDISFLLQKDIRELLLNSLPDYMVPVEFNALRQLPLTSSGKVDRLFLSQREDRVYVNTLNYLPPVTDLEKALAAIWKELLHIERVGIEDNFFDLGGHSLLAMRVISAIRKELEIELNIKELFLHPTIGLLAVHIQQLTKGLLLPAIEVADPRPARIPLSFSQERLWFIDQLDGSLQYHMPAVLRLKGSLDKDALSGSLQQIINRHEVLRTVIREEKGQGYQLIKEKDAWKLTAVDGSKHREDEEGLQQYIKKLIEIPFNLTEDYMLRAVLVTLSDRDHILVATLHHIASDGWSTSVMVRELAALYNASVEHRTIDLAALPIQYADYAIWQRKYLQGETWDKKLGYWKDKLGGVAALQLPTDYTRPLVQSTKGAIKDFKIDKELSDQLKSLSQQQGATLFMTLLAAFNVLLYRYSGQHDICIGTPIAGRQQHELEGLIGFFVNTLALRNELVSDAPFTDLLQQVKTTTLEAYMHQEVPFEKVVELVATERDMSRSPLFQVMLALQNTPDVQELQLGELQFSAGTAGLSGHNTSIFELTFAITEAVQGLHVTVEYCTDLFNEHTISQMTDHFRNLLRSIVKAPHQSIGTLPMLTEVETRYLLAELNDTKRTFLTNRTVVDLFEENVLKNPQAIALVFNGEQLTYHELNERCNRLAHYLKGKGVKEEILVPVCMRRSIELITAMLGILKAGGAYVPIDPEYPAERIGFMLEDTGASWVLTSKEISQQFPVTANIEIIDPGGLASFINQQPVHNLQRQAEPHHLAYMIYTSGSTGRPKGVMIEHKSLANLVNWHNREYEVTPSCRATVMAGVGFDALGWEIWPYLSCGASLFMVDDDTRLSPPRLLELYIANDISHSFIATALVHDFVQETRNKKSSLQYLLTGGDRLSYISNNGLLYKLINNYGPTENTVVATNYELFTNDVHTIPPIGKPISNTIIYLLNEQNQLVPAGVPGELCIGGASLARGYLNRPDLTAEKFISNPFDKTSGARLYKSGDLCRWLPDGNIEYLGRIDEQVKVRGYRIELGEIEHVLQEFDAVRQAVVLAKEDKEGNKKLVGYIVAEGLFSRDAIISYLKGKLPEYMIPAVWVEMEGFALTNNGKIDKKALPDPDVSALIKNQYVAPRTEMEEKLAEIWKDLLQVDQVGVYDDFFELGGHSLLAMRMVAYIENSLLVSVPIKVLFKFTRISDLSKYLETQLTELPEKNTTSYKVYDV